MTPAPLFFGVLVDARSALFLHQLLGPGRRQLAINGQSLRPHELELLDAIDRLASKAPVEPQRPPLRTWVSASEAAARLGVSTRRVTAMLHEARLRGEKVLNVWRVDPDDLALLVEFRRSEPPEPSTEAA